MDDDIGSDLGRFSHAFHLSPIKDSHRTPKFEQHKIPRKAVRPISSHQSYEALKADEEYNKLLYPASNETPILEPNKGIEQGFNNGWPTGPKRLNEWTWKRCAIFTGDILMTCLPLTFVVFGICALALDRKPLSTFGHNIIEGTKFGPTVFPIVFAAIAGRFFRNLARWKAEKGATLGLLEQLVGSQNLTSAFQRVVLLQRYGPLGFATVMFWLLSPLGGQSSLRILDIVPTAVLSETPVHYFDVNYTDGTIFLGADDISWAGTSVSALFQASLMASVQVKNSPVDLWNNVKIPMIDEMSPWTKEISGNPWIDINRTNSNPVYSSLSGLNINGLPEGGGSLFNIETSYMQLTCDDGKVFYGANTSSDDFYSYVFPDGLQWHNTSYPFSGPDISSGTNLSTSFFLDTVRPSSETPLNILYGSLLDYDISDAISESMTLYKCTVGTARVEAGVSCDRGSCAVDRMRRSTVDTRSPLMVPFSGSDFPNFCLFLGFVTGAPHDAVPSAVDYYIVGNDLPFSSVNTSLTYADVSGEMFAKRLSTVMNTLWQASLGPTTLGLGTSAQWTENVSDVATGIPQGVAQSFFAKPSTAQLSTEVQLYQAHRLYISLLLAVVILLQICAVAGLMLKYVATTPDILGYVSTQTRDNPHVQVPVGGNVLDGLDRARLLGDMKVQIGDLRWQDNLGHVGFRSVERREDWALSRVKKGRLYL